MTILYSLMLTLIFSTKTITLVEYESNEFIPGIYVSFGDSETVTDINGKFNVDLSTVDSVLISAVGWHDTYISSLGLSRIDTVYFFPCPLTHKRSGKPKVIKNEHIKSGHIIFEKANVIYEYVYDKDNNSLHLNVKN